MLSVPSWGQILEPMPGLAVLGGERLNLTCGLLVRCPSAILEQSNLLELPATTQLPVRGDQESLRSPRRAEGFPLNVLSASRPERLSTP
jgi:hypothetical protein